MAVLTWDDVGERIFQTGVDHGVLYLDGGVVVPWNGLTSVEDQSTHDVNSYYLDGVKYLHRQISGGFSAKLKAFTYPDEFDDVNGIETIGGVSFHNQNSKSFSMSYRTRVGNDVDGTDHGYKIHILYNVIAIPDSYGYETLQESVKPTEFSWTLDSIPPVVIGHKPTSHFSIDSRNIDPEDLLTLESMLYGTDTTSPYLPSIASLTDLLSIARFGTLVIIDNGDGTWTAVDEANLFITMNDGTTFTITGADATMIDADSYTISTTEPA